jgi:hypothetical protein
MDFSVSFSGKFFKAYQTQSVIAERIKQSNFKSVQTQRDTVTISSQAREEFEKNRADAVSQGTNGAEVAG